jgi:exopolyphosphatase/guanosine-5'-triphosphate,3'-diphosphate pyrophosphatase
LKDGILAQMLAEQDARATGHQEFEHERWQSVLATARRYGVDPRQAEPVRGHALQLFRELKALHQLPPEYENWLAAAALLRDTGKFINHQGHHRHSQYIISSSEMYGYTRVQRTVVSAIARYLGKSRPQPGDRALRNIPTEEHKNVHRAVVLLRLAEALNQDRASDVLRVAAKIYPKRVYLEIKPGRTGAELELWSLRKEAGYFREVFGRAGHPWIDEPLKLRRVAIEIDAGHGSLAHAEIRSAVAGDELAQELKQVGIVAYDEDAFTVGILGK